MKASLILADGTLFEGESFGFEAPTNGEIVFNTSVNGYPEILTDPSSRGQIIVMTYPLIGNYGVQPISHDKYGVTVNAESDHIHAKALIVSDYSEFYSHWNATQSLGDWLKAEKITALQGIDTRQLAQHIRNHGTMSAKIVFKNMPKPAEFTNSNLVDQVSCTEPIVYNEGGKKRVVLLDNGVKAGVLRTLINNDITVVRVPWNYDFTGMEYDGLLISNGPGNPNFMGKAIENIQKAMETDKPIIGIEMGCLLFALAAGMDLFKLKFGHHTHNQSVRVCGTDRCLITIQNHNYAIRKDSVMGGWRVWMENLNDGSVEAIAHTEKPWTAIMFHSEADIIKTDADFIYNDFFAKL